MRRNLLARAFLRTTLLSCSMILIASILPALGGDDDQTIRNAATVLRAAMSDNNVPSSLFANADCIVVLAGVRKFGFGIGGGSGRGAMSCRTGRDSAGNWSAPAVYRVGGVDPQLGGSSSDYVLFIMDQWGVQFLLSGRIQLGSDARVVAGPSGSTALNTMGSDILTYGRSKGLFSGVSMGDASLEPDTGANKRLYGKGISVHDILITNAVTTPAAGRDFTSTLTNRFARVGSGH